MTLIKSLYFDEVEHTVEHLNKLYFSITITF